MLLTSIYHDRFNVYIYVWYTAPIFFEYIFLFFRVCRMADPPMILHGHMRGHHDDYTICPPWLGGSPQRRA